ncbi:MAG: hypothetical protein ABIC19_00705 [Patescibacteria group bacterium]|nr:hypothetical protein [Patescibacteria group bacterium]
MTKKLAHLKRIKKIITKNLDTESRNIVGRWIMEVLNDPRPDWIRNVYERVRRWERMNNHHALALGWTIEHVLRGDSIDSVVSGSEFRGDFFCGIGIGTGSPTFFQSKRRRFPRDLVGVKIYGRGVKEFKIRKLFAEAKKIIEQRSIGQTFLPI